MTRRNVLQRSPEDLLEELTACKVKLNQQKVEIEHLTRARDMWRLQASPRPLACCVKTWSSPFNPQEEKSAESAIRMARMQLLANWSTEVQVPGMYTIRLSEEVRPPTDITPWAEYRITLRVWEEPDHGTTDHNTGK